MSFNDFKYCACLFSIVIISSSFVLVQSEVIKRKNEFFGIAHGVENVPSSNLSKERGFFVILNKARRDSSMQPLMIDKDLTRAARYHSYDMATQNYFSHDTYDRNPLTDSLEYICNAHDRTQKFVDHETERKIAKISACCSENCCHDAITSMDVFNAYLNSPGHRENMFNPNHRLIGIGYINIPGSKKPHCWTMDFGN